MIRILKRKCKFIFRQENIAPGIENLKKVVQKKNGIFKYKQTVPVYIIKGFRVKKPRKGANSNYKNQDILKRREEEILRNQNPRSISIPKQRIPGFFTQSTKINEINNNNQITDASLSSFVGIKLPNQKIKKNGNRKMIHEINNQIFNSHNSYKECTNQNPNPNPNPNVSSFNSEDNYTNNSLRSKSFMKQEDSLVIKNNYSNIYHLNSKDKKPLIKINNKNKAQMKKFGNADLQEASSCINSDTLYSKILESKNLMNRKCSKTIASNSIELLSFKNSITYSSKVKKGNDFIEMEEIEELHCAIVSLFQKQKSILKSQQNDLQCNEKCLEISTQK